MGENTFVETLMNNAHAVSSPALDDTDIDLLCMKCIEAEAQRDDALENIGRIQTALDEAVFERDEAFLERDEAVFERDEALQKLKAWNDTAVGAAALARLASEQVWISRGY
ncbi:hypothetical protein B0H10DRAFT_1951296 [Mycena sp. CBHHK59/15]|nr:hypothetical protein B0H10DRAFT_1951296 [Mycena sp. CBHHK59/15]